MLLRPLVVISREECEEELRRVEVDHSCIDVFIEKRDSFLLKITGLSTPAANILKQIAISFGADVAVHREVITGKVDCSDAIFMGTKRQLRRTVLALSSQPFGLAGLERQVVELLSRLDKLPAAIDLPLGRLTFDRPLIMGVLNVTPDSFSDGGLFLEPDAARRRIDEMIEQGADIVDVGAESTRPGSDPVPVSEQLRRLSSIFDHLQTRHVLWSIDTTNPDVARAALDKGASIVNNVSGGTNPALWQLAGEYCAAFVLMHIQGTPKIMQQDPHYDDFNAELFRFFSTKLEEIQASDFPRDRVIIDPGIGFGKRVHDNTAAIRRLGELRAFGLPILLGASRKSFLGKLLGLEVNDRLEASLASAVLAFAGGANILRVHDVSQTRKAMDAAAAIRSANGEE
ncbi:dihydropteroate synthase [candidate division TA06 bacterium B3_TA06]|uniref:dihydropteroate synthase n=1 Tax=candidate division TA06 bacterium B3_TA06 TaxID=2012487 RepID=A0A532V0C8_UNCT6|nr:MAG: dihydropteroate synthase [candidate division TA06 bacterium B3_TA06]